MWNAEKYKRAQSTFPAVEGSEMYTLDIFSSLSQLSTSFSELSPLLSIIFLFPEISVLVILYSTFLLKYTPSIWQLFFQFSLFSSQKIVFFHCLGYKCCLLFPFAQKEISRSRILRMPARTKHPEKRLPKRTKISPPTPTPRTPSPTPLSPKEGAPPNPQQQKGSSPQYKK